MEKDKRLVFDTIPEKFDKWRVRYNPALFDYILKTTGLGPGRSCLEIGPGTGQASDFAVKSGADYLAIELGSHLADKMREKYSSYPNFHIVNDDFETHDFEGKKFDLIYSAATIQWIKEDVAYSRVYELLKDGGYLAMCLMRSEYKSENPKLYEEIQKVYDAYFKPEIPYTHGKFHYDNAPAYGFTDFERREFYGRREMTTEEYLAFCGTHCDHLVIPEPYRSKFFDGLRKAVTEGGGKVVFRDTYVLYLVKKPE